MMASSSYKFALFVFPGVLTLLLSICARSFYSKTSQNTQGSKQAVPIGNVAEVDTDSTRLAKQRPAATTNDFWQFSDPKKLLLALCDFPLDEFDEMWEFIGTYPLGDEIMLWDEFAPKTSTS